MSRNWPKGQSMATRCKRSGLELLVDVVLVLRRVRGSGRRERTGHFPKQQLNSPGNPAKDLRCERCWHQKWSYVTPQDNVINHTT